MTMQENSSSGPSFLPVPVAGGGPVTMSSREIAELCETRHNQVVETIERLMVSGVLRESRKTTRRVQPAGGGRPMDVYDLTKRDTLVVVSGYKDEVRAKIIDRWMELEDRAQHPVVDPAAILNDPAAMRGLLLTYTEKVIALEGEVEEMRPQVQEQAHRLKKLDRLEGAQGSMCISDAAKTLGVGRKQLFDFMSARRWIFKRPGNKNWLAYDDKRKALLLEHDDHLYMDNLGQERVATRVLVTAKGLVKLAELLEQPLH